MTGKRFKKLLMGCCMPRDVAEAFRRLVNELGDSYAEGLEDLKRAVREILTGGEAK